MTEPANNTTDEKPKLTFEQKKALVDEFRANLEKISDEHDIGFVLSAAVPTDEGIHTLCAVSATRAQLFFTAKCMLENDEVRKAIKSATLAKIVPDILGFDICTIIGKGEQEPEKEEATDKSAAA